VDRFPASEARTGPAYEADRVPARAQLAAAAAPRRILLGADLVLVFETPDTVRTALEESLRAERATDPDRIRDETAAFAELLGGDGALAATLYVDVADPVALSERLSELGGVEEAVSLEVGGRRAKATADPGDGGIGAFHLLFELDGEQRTMLLGGAPVSVRLDHPAHRAVATLNADQVLAIGVDLRR
jgi:Protein of unknown function (DUF3501)